MSRRLISHMLKTPRLRGAAGQQYAIIVGLISVIAILAVTQMGSGVKSLMTNTGNTLTNVVNGTVGSGGSGGSSPPPPPPPSNCSLVRASCQAHLTAGCTTSGTFQIDPDAGGSSPQFEAYCDMTTAGGGWTLVFRASNNDTTRFWQAPTTFVSTSTINPTQHTTTTVDYKNEGFSSLPTTRWLLRNNDGYLLHGQCSTTNESARTIFMGSQRLCTGNTVLISNSFSTPVTQIGVQVNEPGCSYSTPVGDDCTFLDFNPQTNDRGSCWNSGNYGGIGCVMSGDTSPANVDVGRGNSTDFMEIWVR